MTPVTSMGGPIASPSFLSPQSHTSITSPKPQLRAVHSLTLSCQSPDALSVHTIVSNNSSIQTQTLPLNHESSKTIKTDLPKWLIASLKVDPPRELICIDNDATTSSSLKKLSAENGQQGHRISRKVSLPLLCIYTIKAVYIIQITVLPSPISDDEDSSLLCFRGNIESIREPLESYLQDQNQENNFNLVIQRVRPAPYSHLNGGTTYNAAPFIPRGSMAILLSSSNNQTYGNDGVDEMSYSQIILYHGIDNENQIGVRNNHDTSSKSHNNNISVSTVHTFHRIVDFCFLPSYTSSSGDQASNSSSLWNGMSIALSTRHGEIYTMTPIVFHGMAVPKHLITDAITNLKAITNNSNITNNKLSSEKENRKSESNVNLQTIRDGGNCVLQRRNAATLAYIKDVFGIIDDEQERKISCHKKKVGPYIVTANIFNHHDKRRTAASWPIAIQGPVYTPSEACAYEVCCMESLPSPFPSSSSLDDEICCTTGYTSSLILARGKHGQCVQYVMIPSGANCVPRFLFESGDDCEVLNRLIDNTGTLVEEIWIESDQEDDITVHNSDDQNIQLALLESKNTSDEQRRDHNIVVIIDPIDTTMVHHVSNFGVVTITTNATKVMGHRLSQLVSEGKMSNEEIKTKMWSSIDILRHGDASIDYRTHVSGVCVSGDAKIGHLLVAVLSDGKTEVVNLTAVQYLNEARSNRESTTEVNARVKSDEEKEADEAVVAIEELPPLHEKISPLLEKISDGLSGMSKMVGGSTEPQNVTPGAVAVFVSTKQTCEQDIIVPLRNLHALISPHIPYLQSLHKHQILQLDRLKGMMQKLEERIGATKKKLLVIDANHNGMSQRSADILVTSRELAPSVTRSEQEYFKDVQRCEANCSKWEQNFTELQARCKVLSQGIKTAQVELKIKAELNDDQKETCRVLLEGQRSLLKKSEMTLREAEKKVITLLDYSISADTRPQSSLTITSSVLDPKLSAFNL